MGLLQRVVGLLKHVVGDPHGYFVFFLGHHLTAGDILHASSGMAGDDGGPVKVL